MGYRDMLKKINADYIKRGAKGISETDLNKILQKASFIIEKAKKNETLKKVVKDIATLISLVRDYVKGDYKGIPWYSLSAIGFTLLYIFNPLDLIPDFIPGLGMIDDAAVVALCLKMVSKDIAAYRKWQGDSSMVR